jgi:hypothetical protein
MVQTQQQQQQAEQLQYQTSSPFPPSPSKRRVIDVQQTLASTKCEDESLRVVVALYTSLPDPLQIVLAKTAVCTFFQRPANKATDGEKYSEEAAKYLSDLERLRPHMIQEASTIVCFSCACCGGHNKFVRMRSGIDVAAHMLVESLRQLTNHTARCVASKKIIGRQVSSTLLNFNFTNGRSVIQHFARMWLIHLQGEYLLTPPPAASRGPREVMHQLKVIPFFNGALNGDQKQTNNHAMEFTALKQILLHSKNKETNHMARISKDCGLQQISVDESSSFFQERQKSCTVWGGKSGV